MTAGVSGPVELRIGASSADIRHAHQLRLVEPRRVVGFDRVMTPEIEIAGSDS